MVRLFIPWHKGDGLMNKQRNTKMKKIKLLLPTLTILTVSTFSGLQTFAQDSGNGNGEQTAEVKTFVATARYENPLDTFERCDAFSFAGISAARIAQDEAVNACKDEFNADCIVVSADYQDIVSTEFIGYKACSATVTVHGYKLN
jgi:hypothetical protein